MTWETWNQVGIDLGEIDKKMCPTCELSAICLPGIDDFAWLSRLMHGGNGNLNTIMCNHCTELWLLDWDATKLTAASPAINKQPKTRCARVVRYIGYWSNRLNRCPKCEPLLKIYSVVKPDEKWGSCVFVHHIQWVGNMPP